MSIYKSYKCVFSFFFHLFDTIVLSIFLGLTFFETLPMPSAYFLSLVEAKVQTWVFCFGLILKGCLSSATSLFVVLAIHFTFISSPSRHINMTGGISSCIQRWSSDSEMSCTYFKADLITHVLMLTWAPSYNNLCVIHTSMTGTFLLSKIIKCFKNIYLSVYLYKSRSGSLLNSV